MLSWWRTVWCDLFHRDQHGHKCTDTWTVDHVCVRRFICNRCARPAWRREEDLPAGRVGAPRRGPSMTGDHQRLDEEPVAQKGHRDGESNLS